MIIRNVVCAAALMPTAAALPALAQDFCQAAGDKISLGFEVKPSLVAHSDAIRDHLRGCGRFGRRAERALVHAFVEVRRPH